MLESKRDPDAPIPGDTNHTERYLRPMSELGFLIIGAQKAGTTSLFEYIRRHPQIYMPAEKEVYFFNSDQAYRRGRDWYLSTMLKGAPAGSVCGEATAQYMAGVPYRDATDKQQLDKEADADDSHRPEEIVPRRIYELFPDVKLICVLRDPVARAYSHYRMAALSRTESRSFDEVVAQLTEPSILERARIAHTYTDDYIILGEYARILAGFLRIFSREQLMIIFSSDLEQRPTETLASVFRFIGVQTDFVPDNLDTRYLAAAVKQRIPGLNLFVWKSKIARLRTARALWHALPASVHRSIGRTYSVSAYRLQLWNARRDAARDDMTASARTQLITHFRPDSEALRDLLNMEIPWLEDWARRS
jgi:hypothetical protein